MQSNNKQLGEVEADGMIEGVGWSKLRQTQLIHMPNLT